MKLFKLLLVYLLTVPLIGQDNFIALADGTKLYIEEAGKGQAMIFITGWTMTSRFFEKQMDYFSKDFHVFTYDPRGQGRSTKALTKNNYAIHASDLRQILLKRNLNDVILVGWSSGCLAVYEYLRAFEKDRISKIVLIDEPPKWIGDINSEWGYGSFNGYRSSLKDLISKEILEPDGIIDWMLVEPIDSLTRKWMKKEIQMTPMHVALSLYINGLISDYTSEVSTFSSQLPMLFMVRSSWYDQAAKWLKKNAAPSKVVSISSHAMFWERPMEFNKLLVEFLEEN